MHVAERETPAGSGQAEIFATTHWSVVLAAGRSDTALAAPALAQLCQTYWYPIYAFARRSGEAPPDAEDLTQGFFAHFLEHNLAGRVGPERGKFRSYLLVCFKNFRASQRARESYQKRGGGRGIISLDAARPEDRYRLEPVEAMDPEKLYELSWTLALLDRVVTRLGEELAVTGKPELFAYLKPRLLGEPAEKTYAEIGVRFGLSEGAVTNMVYRMRQRYRELFRKEIANTVAGPEEFEGELRHLFAVLGGRGK